jgi:hypothetical protein
MFLSCNAKPEKALKKFRGDTQPLDQLKFSLCCFSFNEKFKNNHYRKCHNILRCLKNVKLSENWSKNADAGKRDRNYIFESMLLNISQNIKTLLNLRCLLRQKYTTIMTSVILLIDFLK